MKGTFRLLPLALIIGFNVFVAGSPPVAAGAQAAGAARETDRQAAPPEPEKKSQSDRAAKTLKIYKSLRPEQAARLIDRMDEGTAAEIMSWSWAIQSTTP